MGAKVQKMY